MKTVWLCQDDEAEYDMLQAYYEACRRSRRIPDMARWAQACDVMFDLEDQAGDIP